MDTQDLILENTAMLRVMFRNQIQMVSMMTELIGFLDQSGDPEAKSQWRARMLEIQLQMAQLKVENERDKIKLAMYDTAG